MNKTQTLFLAASLIFLFSVQTIYAYPYDYHSYTISGEDETGNSIEGVIYFKNGESFLYGKIIDENGRINEFRGEWGPIHVWSYYE